MAIRCSYSWLDFVRELPGSSLADYSPRVLLGSIVPGMFSVSEYLSVTNCSEATYVLTYVSRFHIAFAYIRLACTVPQQSTLECVHLSK